MTILKAILIFTLAGIVLSLSTFSYSFPAQATSTYQQPAYALGTLTLNTVLNLNIQLPDGSGYDLSSAYFSISITDYLNQNIVYTFGGASCSSSNSCMYNWTVPATASYYLRIAATSAATQTQFLVRYNLFASVNNSPVLKLSDVLRQHVIKYFYLNQSTTVTLYQSPVTIPANSFLRVLTMDPSNPTKLKVLTSSVPSIVISSGSSVTYSMALSSGYYGIQVITETTVTTTINFQSDSYPCPFTSQFPDYYSVFQGCTLSSTGSSTGLPCLAYDYTNLACYSCMTGYTLKNGKCQSSNPCSSRQYYHFGNCYDASYTCGNFDPYTGACTTCADSTYQLINDQCVIASFCPPDHYLKGSICIDNKCGVYNPTNGSCISCISATYYLSNGSCLPVNCGNNSYYSVVASACTTVPIGCYNFSISAQVCYACNVGYSLQQGVCTGTTSAANCWLYDTLAQVCKQCQTGYYYTSQNTCVVIPTSTLCLVGQVLVNGVCINIPTCATNQVVVNGACATLPPNCLNLDSTYNCIQCTTGYLYYQGQCSYCNGPNPTYPCITCLLNQFVNALGQCEKVSAYCGDFSSANGWCKTCTNGLTPVNGLCCASGYSITTSDGICSTSQSSGSSSSSGGSKPLTYQQIYGKYCGAINPSLKICTKCLSGHDFDKNGICI